MSNDKFLFIIVVVALSCHAVVAITGFTLGWDVELAANATNMILCFVGWVYVWTDGRKRKVQKEPLPVRQEIKSLVLVKGEFPLEIERNPESGWYIATSRDVPGLLLAGSDPERLKEQAKVVAPMLLKMNKQKTS